MEIHVLQYTTTQIDIFINGLTENSYIFYPEAGTTKKIDAKGISVNKLAEEANTDIGIIQRDSDGNIISSSSESLERVAPFSYIANSTSDLTLMESIDKKMINAVMKTVWGVIVFDPSGNYIEPVDFEVAGGVSLIDLSILCGYSYNDLQYSLEKDGGGFGSWVNFNGPEFRIAPLDAGNYSIKVQSSGTQINEIFTRSTTVS